MPPLMTALRTIEAHFIMAGHAPSVRELALLLACLFYTAREQLRRLRSLGFVEWGASAHRTLTITKAGRAALQAER